MTDRTLSMINCRRVLQLHANKDWMASGRACYAVTELLVLTLETFIYWQPEAVRQLEFSRAGSESRIFENCQKRSALRRRGGERKIRKASG
jgi:hypothetical protein